MGVRPCVFQDFLRRHLGNIFHGWRRFVREHIVSWALSHLLRARFIGLLRRAGL